MYTRLSDFVTWLTNWHAVLKKLTRQSVVTFFTFKENDSEHQFAYDEFHKTFTVLTTTRAI